MRRTGVGFITCTTLVVANMVGTGVFTSLGFQVPGLPSGFVLLSLWGIGAAFALCGALCYAELASALPRSGGEYHFLSRIYGSHVGFMAGAVSATVGFAAPVALAAMAFAQYFQAVIFNTSTIMVSTAIVCLVTAAHLITLDSSRRFQVFFTILKLTLIFVIIIAGIMIGPTQSISFLPGPDNQALFFSPSFAISLMYVMYAYSGWNASTYIIGEVEQPDRNVPWSLIIGTAFVGLLYVALNAIFLKTVPLETLSGKLDVGSLAAIAIFGREGGRILSAFICIGLISSISAMMWAGPRVAQTIGEDIPSLALLARRTRGGIPIFAVLLQFGLVILLLWTSTFESVLLYTQFALIFCSLLVVIGVVVLRIREPDLIRPFRCWGYPITPFLFTLIAVFTLMHTLLNRPWHALASIGTLVLALIIYHAYGPRGKVDGT